MAALINHRRSAYVDDDELERTAGALEIAAKTATDEKRAAVFHGGACALGLLNGHDFSGHADFMAVFTRYAFDKEGI